MAPAPAADLGSGVLPGQKRGHPTGLTDYQLAYRLTDCRVYDAALIPASYEDRESIRERLRAAPETASRLIDWLLIETPKRKAALPHLYPPREKRTPKP